MPTTSKVFAVALILLSSFVLQGVAVAETTRETAQLRVAVASNFLPTLRKLVSRYQDESEARIKIIAASTGKLYAQIIHGAPFDIFLSADSRRPQRLIESGHAIKLSRFTYASGKIALWSPQPQVIDCRGALEEGKFKRLAIANPKTAPYGVAAQQLIENLGLWKAVQPKLVRGENIAQTLHYVDSGNAQIGIVALSQVKPLQNRDGCTWEVPTKLYQTIEQQAVLLKRSKHIVAAERFLSFLKSEGAVELIRDSGYGVN